MNKRVFRVASRPSLLAMTQTQQTLRTLAEMNPGVDFEIIPTSTNGDRIVDKPLVSFGGTGLFVKELEQSLLDGAADFAVHSLKDMPSNTPPELFLASFPLRNDPRDVLILRPGLSNLSSGCVVGTGSPRRQFQISNLYRGVTFKDLRGNIDTRLRKLHDGEYDAIVLAAAGLNRLGISPENTVKLDVGTCLPAVGQGALALQCRADDPETIRLLETINHAETKVSVLTERAFMATIGGGCKFPLAAHASVHNEDVTLSCIVGSLSTNEFVRLEDACKRHLAEDMGRSLGYKMIKLCKEKGIEWL